MTAKRAAQRKEQESASLPEVLIPPGDAKENEKAAYWIDLLGNVDQLKAATETTDFFILMQEFPAAVWDRLTIYLYRLPDDNGILLKNADDKPHYIKVLRQPLTEEFVAKNWGGGKYQAYLKIDNKEVLRKHTFRIDGEPKLQPGQRIEIEGKSVPIGSAVAAPPAPQSDIANVIEATSAANKQNMEILAEGSKAAIQLVRDQVAAAAKPDASSEIMDKFLTAMIERVMTPPPTPADPIDTFVKLQSLMKNPATEPVEQKDPPLTEAMELMEKMSGKPFFELIRGKSNPAAPDSPWAPFAPVALQFVTSLPNLMSEFRQTRALEQHARDLEFRRAVWMRTARPGETPTARTARPESRAPTESPASPARRATPTPTQPGTAPDPTQLTNAIIQTICHGFDTDPTMGGETAATIALLYGKQIEALGLEKFLANEQTLTEYVQGIPALAQRSQFATWPQFQDDFLEYCEQRWGVPESDEPVNGQAKIPPGPQPVA